MALATILVLSAWSILRVDGVRQGNAAVESLAQGESRSARTFDGVELEGFALCVSDKIKEKVGDFARSAGAGRVSKADLCAGWDEMFPLILGEPSNGILCKPPAGVDLEDPEVRGQLMGRSLSYSTRSFSNALCGGPEESAAPRELTREELRQVSVCIGLKMREKESFRARFASVPRADVCKAWAHEYPHVLDSPSNGVACNMPPGTGGGNPAVWRQFFTEEASELAERMACGSEG